MKVEAQRIAPAPITKSIRVHASQQAAFDTFVGRMGKWWLKSHSLLKSPQVDVVIEPRSGGRWFEVGEDGSEQMWGRVLQWDAPNRVVLAWQLTGEWAYDENFETTVDVRFIPDGEQTMVEFEHRDLERFGPQAEEIRGGYETGMDGGWTALLDQYRNVTDSAP